MFDEIVTKEGLKFNDLEKKIYKFVCMLGCFIIKYILESRDRKLMKARDTKKFRHKGYKNNCIKTVMGEVEYKRAVYLFEEDGEKKYVYLLDEDMKIETIGKVSVNLAEKAVSIAVNTTSYRKGEEEIKNTTNGTLSHEWLRHLVFETGKKIEQKEETEVELYNQEKLVKGTKEIVALFEEADGRKVFYLDAIDVMPEYQSKGYGTGLISFACEYAKRSDCYKMYLITNKSNIFACKCYEKAGGINKADDEIIYVYEFRK